MTIRILDVKLKDGQFTPEVSLDGLTVSVEAAPFKREGESGTVAKCSISFTSADAGKYVYATLVKRDGQHVYDLRVQDPAAMVPVGLPPSSGDELFAFLSGTVLADGLDLEVRHFTENEA